MSVNVKLALNIIDKKIGEIIREKKYNCYKINELAKIQKKFKKDLSDLIECKNALRDYHENT